MIKVTREMGLLEFNAWSGGRDVLNAIIEHDKRDEIVEYLSEYINEINEYKPVTDTWLNDFLWFDVEDIIGNDLQIALFE